jgi:hypothetical protein
MNDEYMRSLTLFVDAIEATEHLAIVCEDTKDGKDILVVENSNVAKHIDGHQCEVDLAEIFAKTTDEASAQEFVDVIDTTRAPIVLEGVTRIVGYYSRVNNWNKSKIGELRDRNQQNYALAGASPEHDEARHAVINSM